MKVRVTVDFKDKHTGKTHKVGDILDLEVIRINEILSTGSFIELVEQKQEDESVIEKKSGYKRKGHKEDI